MPHPVILAGPRRPSAPALRRFRGSDSGATAVAFALIVPLFLGLVGAILQVAFQIWAAQNFDHALQNGVRSLLTGQFYKNTTNDNPLDALKKLKINICGPTSATIVNVFNCQNIKIDVTIANSFSEAAFTPPIDLTTGTWSAKFGSKYACAKEGMVVVVTAAVPFPTFLNLLGLKTALFTSGSDSGSSLLVSTAAFRTEPYQDPTQGSSACSS